MHFFLLLETLFAIGVLLFFHLQGVNLQHCNRLGIDLLCLYAELNWTKVIIQFSPTSHLVPIYMQLKKCNHWRGQVSLSTLEGNWSHFWSYKSSVMSVLLSFLTEQLQIWCFIISRFVRKSQNYFWPFLVEAHLCRSEFLRVSDINQLATSASCLNPSNFFFSCY